MRRGRQTPSRRSVVYDGRRRAVVMKATVWTAEYCVLSCVTNIGPALTLKNARQHSDCIGK